MHISNCLRETSSVATVKRHRHLHVGHSPEMHNVDVILDNLGDQTSVLNVAVQCKRKTNSHHIVEYCLLYLHPTHLRPSGCMLPALYFIIFANEVNVFTLSVYLFASRIMGNYSTDFYRARLSVIKARSLLWPGVGPSVCLSRSCILSTWLKISSNFFVGPVAPSY